MELKPGSRWKSAVCPAEVVIVRPPKEPPWSWNAAASRWSPWPRTSRKV